MKNLILLILFFSFLGNSQIPTSTQKGYYLQKVGDSVVGQNSRPDKAFFDLYNYMVERKIKKGIVESPYWEITIDYPDAVVVDKEVYKFNPKTSGIIQGFVINLVALNNVNIINAELQKASKEGFTTFEVMGMDAYFDANKAAIQDKNAVKSSVNGIIIPSNMHFKMSPDTYIRVQPNHWMSYWLINLYDVDNVKVSGGNLIGDRYQHDYTTYKNTHEYGFGIAIVGSHNIEIENVLVEKFTGDCIMISNKWIRTVDGLLINGNKASEDVLITNCILQDSRRQGISPVDGNRITIDNNKIRNIGNGENLGGVGSWGTLPKCGIDLESYRIRTPDGKLQEYERIENVVISNNDFQNNNNADVLLYTCNDVDVFRNKFTKALSNNAAFNIKIYDNEFNLPEGTLGAAINLKQNTIAITGEKLSYNYKVYNNKINGSQYGIMSNVDKAEIYNNEIKQFSYIGLNIGGENVHMYDNIVTSTLPNTYGLRNWITASSATNILAERITTDVTEVGFQLQSFTGLGSGITIKDSNFKGGKFDVKVTNSSNVNVTNSIYTKVYNDNKGNGNTNVFIP